MPTLNIVHANQSSETGERLSDEELVAQIRTFVFAATDTTSNALCRILHVLADHPEAQEKLRAEIQATKQVHGTDISFGLLNDLPYLDSVCRETLRL